MSGKAIVVNFLVICGVGIFLGAIPAAIASSFVVAFYK